MHHPLLSLIICFLLGLSFLHAQERIHYDISFPNAVHHEAEISITYRNLSKEPLEMRMSLSSPGRYAVHQFGKNVSQVRAWDQNEKPLNLKRTAPEMWTVSQHKGWVRISYTLFADWTDGTYSEIDESHAHLNMPATFMWARNMEEHPISVTFQLSQTSKWQIATQLAPIRKPNTYSAPNLQYFLDSPTELSDFDKREWYVKDPTGHGAGFQLVVHHDGSEAEVDQFQEMVKKNVEEMIAVYGELPAFDHNAYTFLCDYRPGNDGDGMEHRNSTVITSSQSLAASIKDRMGTVSHEFFHAWNVERIRPKSLEPFDFEQPNMSSELWFAEGFTSYYGPLVLARADIYDLSTYAGKISGSLNYVLNRPGSQIASPVEMSQMAAFVDAATAVDPTAFHNTFTSYYAYGAVVALALDLEIRTNYEGLSLDNVMQEIWRRYGKTEIPYTNRDLLAVLAEVVNDKAFAESFFDSFIFGHERPDHEMLLAHAGLRLRTQNPGEASLGLEGIGFSDDQATITYGTLKGSPLYKAGLERGDILISIDGRSLKHEKALAKSLKNKKPGDTASVVFQRQGTMQTRTLTLIEDPTLEVVTFEASGETISDEIRAFRKAWLGSKVKQ